jgi:hypothetical protein
MPKASKLSPRAIFLGVILTLATIIAVVSSPTDTQAIPELVVTVGDTVGNPGEQNAVVTVFMSNPFDSVFAFQLWLKIGNPFICEFQVDTVTLYDTLWFVCNEYSGPDCQFWYQQQAEITYWRCDSVDESICVDSSLVPPESSSVAEWTIVADSMYVDIHDEVVGNWDTTGTLLSGWELVESRSVFSGVQEMLITGQADRYSEPGSHPSIAPQQNGVLFRIRADIHNIPDSLEGEDRKSYLYTDAFRQYFRFVTHDSRELGVSDSIRVDTNFYYCEDWVPPDSTSCAKWTKVGGEPYDSVAVDSVTVYYIDTSKVWLFPGSITVLYGQCGQIDGDPQNLVDIGDLTYLIGYLYLEGPEPQPLSAANVDCDPQSIVDIGDLTYLIAYLYLTGPDPCACE